MNRTISRKNRIENGLRGIESKFTPHSKQAYFSHHFFVSLLTIRGRNSKDIIIIVEISMYIVRSIYLWSFAYSEIRRQKMYAWIIQMINSNIIYSLDKVIRSRSGFILQDTLDRKINFMITCPAVILAASRKLSVRGRRVVLINSIIVKNGLSHIGASSGRKCAVNFFAEDIIFLIIKNIHSGRPIDIVNKICLVMLKR